MTSPLATQIVEFDISKRSYRSIPVSEFQLNQTDDHIIYWVHVDLNQLTTAEVLFQQLNLPSNIIKLCEEQNRIPKLDEQYDSIGIQMECLLQGEITYDDLEISFGNLILCLTKKYCFTATAEFIPSLFDFHDNFLKAVKYAQTPCFILFLIFDNVINDFSNLLLRFEFQADQIDLHIRETKKNIYNNVMHVQKQVMKVQHHIAVIRDILMRISGRKIPVISEPCRLSLENLLDHSHIIFNEAGAVREILRSTLDQIDNALMQKMNNTMKILTAFAAIFLPLTLVTGIYGMNFEWIPELHWKYGYFWALSLMFLVGLLLVYLFRKMDWF